MSLDLPVVHGDDGTWGAKLNAALADLDTRVTAAVPAWKPTTAYTAGQSVINPSGEVVSALATFTSGASYNAANWSTPASGTYAPIVNAAHTGTFGVNATSAKRQPVNIASTLDAADLPGTQDKVGAVLSTTVKGDFTGLGGSNPGFVFGMNVFTVTGSAANDAKGINALIGAIMEADIATPAGVTIASVQGLLAQAAFFGAAAGATVTQMESLRVAAPIRKDGATAGTATNVYGLFVEAVTSGAVGATGSAFSLFVAGGNSRFGGRLDVAGSIANTTGNLELFADFSRAAGASLVLDANTSGGSTGTATAYLSKAGSAFRVHDGTKVVWSVGRDGLVTTTVGLPPHSMDPRLNTVAAGSTTANRRTYHRVRGASLACSKIALLVGTSSGNISVEVYSNTGTGSSARPTGAPRASSGSVACPASGEAQVALASSVTISEGDWIALWCDNATATFGRAPASAMTAAMPFVCQENSTTAGASVGTLLAAGNSYFLVGVE